MSDVVWIFAFLFSFPKHLAHAVHQILPKKSVDLQWIACFFVLMFDCLICLSAYCLKCYLQNRMSVTNLTETCFGYDVCGQNYLRLLDVDGSDGDVMSRCQRMYAIPKKACAHGFSRVLNCSTDGDEMMNY